MRTLENVPVSDAVAIIFGEEGKDHVANVSFDGITNAYELFALCTRIMWNGLRYVKQCPAGDELDLESLTRSDLEHVRYCMYRAGIVVSMEIMPVTEVAHDCVTDVEKDAIKHVVTNDNPSCIDNHILIIGTRNYRFVVGFHCVVHGEEEFE